MLKLRAVGTNDCRLVWEWANDPVARSVSFQSDPIPWETHVRWFERRLSDGHCFFYVGENEGGQLVGQVRFEISGDDAAISVAVAPASRGKGYGSGLIRAGAMHLFAVSSVNSIHAYIKPDNEASIRAFATAGFVFLDDCVRNSHPAKHLVLSRSVAGS